MYMREIVRSFSTLYRDIQIHRISCIRCRMENFLLFLKSVNKNEQSSVLNTVTSTPTMYMSLLTVLAGRREAHVSTTGAVHARADAPILRQVLHARSGEAGRGIHPVLVLSASEKGPYARVHTVQREYCRSYGQLHSTR